MDFDDPEEEEDEKKVSIVEEMKSSTL